MEQSLPYLIKSKTKYST